MTNAVQIPEYIPEGICLALQICSYNQEQSGLVAASVKAISSFPALQESFTCEYALPHAFAPVAR